MPNTKTFRILFKISGKLFSLDISKGTAEAMPLDSIFILLYDIAVCVNIAQTSLKVFARSLIFLLLRVQLQQFQQSQWLRSE